jgi:hypothetical protein
MGPFCEELREPQLLIRHLSRSRRASVGAAKGASGGLTSLGSSDASPMQRSPHTHPGERELQIKLFDINKNRKELKIHCRPRMHAHALCACIDCIRCIFRCIYTAPADSPAKRTYGTPTQLHDAAWMTERSLGLLYSTGTGKYGISVPGYACLQNRGVHLFSISFTMYHLRKSILFFPEKQGGTLI